MADGRSAALGLLTEYKAEKRGNAAKTGLVPEYRVTSRGSAAAVAIVTEYKPLGPQVLYASGFEMGTANEFVFDGWYNTSSMAIDSTPANLHLINGLGGSRCLNLTYWAELVVSGGTGRFLHLGYRSKMAVPTSYQYIQFQSLYGSEFTIRFETTGLIVLRRGGETGTVVATSALSIDYTQYHWIVLEMVVDNTTGLCVVKVDGVEMVTFSGDTKASSGAELAWNKIRFQANGSIGMYLDDVIVTDDLMGEVPECCGVLHVPDGPGDSTAWTPLSGANWTNVDDPTSTATYVEATAPRLDDLYTVSAPVGIDSVVFVKTDAVVSSQADQKHRSLLRIDGLTYESDPDLAGGANAFRLIHSYWTEHPMKHRPFTKAEIKNLQIGLRT